MAATAWAGGPLFLIVEDDELVARWLERVLSRFRPARRARTLTQARTIVDDPACSLVAIVCDVGMPDGCGLGLARYARERRSATPILVLTGNTQSHVVNDAFVMGVSFLSKPATEDSIGVFAHRAVSMEAVGDSRILRALEDVAAECHLTERETELLGLAVADRTRTQLATALGVSENTAKSQVRAVLRKSGARDLDHLVRLVLRRALDGHASPPTKH